MYRFSAHHSNLTHNIQQIKLKIFATSVVREKSKAEMIWHESYLESIGEIGKIFFLGIHNLDDDNTATLPRKLFPSKYGTLLDRCFRHRKFLGT